MAVSVTTAPAERSIPSLPLMMTSVCPAAITPRNTESRRMLTACALATNMLLPKPFGSSPLNANRMIASRTAATGGEIVMRFIASSGTG